MDIVVMGKGKLNFKPDQIVINFDFNAKEKTYEQVLQQGTAGVEKYLNLLLSLGFKKEDFKTRSFRVSENREYDNMKRIYVSKGFVFNQSARIKFDYDMENLAQLMEKTSAFDDAPTYRIDFAIKDEKSAEGELLKLAYKDAEMQAKFIASASGKELKDCVKVSFEPFDEKLTSESRLGSNEMMYCAKASARAVSESIQTVFVPEDVVVEKEIYCLFVTK